MDTAYTEKDLRSRNNGYEFVYRTIAGFKPWICNIIFRAGKTNDWHYFIQELILNTFRIRFLPVLLRGQVVVCG